MRPWVRMKLNPRSGRGRVPLDPGEAGSRVRKALETLDLLLRKMDSDLPQNFQKELTCAICLNHCIDPVTMGCGHSFCCSCLYVSWEKAESPTCCPEPSEQKILKTNITLQNLVSMARKASLGQFLSSEDNRCGLHRRQSRSSVKMTGACSVCTAPALRSTRPTDTAPWKRLLRNTGKKLSNQMRSLWEKIQEIKKTLSKDGRIPVYWMAYLYKRQDETRAFYETLQLVLQEEDKKNLERLIDEESKLSEQLKKCQAKRVSRCSAHASASAARTHCTSHHWTDGQAQHFRVGVSFTGEITHDNIQLFNDVRSLRFMGDLPHVSRDPGASNCFAAWGAHVFKSGKHYWEVYVDKSWDWAVGVCEDPWMKKNGTLTECKDTFLLIHVKDDNQTTLWTTAPMARQYIQKPLGGLVCSLMLTIEVRSPFQEYIGDLCNNNFRPYISLATH
ncbi:LOW QUALITY PROTEIN: hypothetical protein QTO34_004012, partial [Cnephaeus nilssonii]